MSFRFKLMLVGCLFFASFACRDESEERFLRAKYATSHLIELGTSVNDKAFDSVVEALKLIPKENRHFAESQKILFSIENGRQHVRTPLALAPKPGSRPLAIEAQLKACATLAQLAGADGGVPRALRALEECRKQAEMLELHYSHGDDDAGIH